MKEVFEDIIKNRRWQDVLCGTGSTMQFTEPLRNNLKSFLEKHNLKSMLDAPCGDYSWMSKTNLPANFKYIGADIVQSLVDTNQATYPGIEFHCIDITKDALPTVDVLFCRDCLIHLSISDIKLVFDNIVKSNIQYVMLTNYHAPEMSDIITGRFRGTNFKVDPFNFEDPIDSMLDWVPNTKNGDQKKDISLWHRSTIEKYLSHI
jgi:hypothetical protein